MVSDGHHSQLTPCPRCRYSDCVLSVPAARISARSTEAARRMVRDDEALTSRRRDAGATLAAALPIVDARELEVAPSQYLGCYGILLIKAGVVAVAMLAIYATAAHGTAGGIALLVAGSVAGVLSMLGLAMLIRGFARLSGIAAGRPAAEAIWRRGWYCYRCTVVFFGPGEEPAGIGPGQPLTPAQFRQVVWGAGGFGKPAPGPGG
jgi:hypothetical protein